MQKGIHAASPTQEPLSHRMSDSGAGEYADRAFLMTDNQGDNPMDIREKTLMAITEGIHKSITSEFAPIEGEGHLITPKEGRIIIYKPSDDILRVSNVTSTPEGGALETVSSDKKVDVCQESESSGSQLLMETSSLQIFKEVPLHQVASGAEVALNLLNPLSVGIQSAKSKMSDTVQKSESLAHDQANEM